ncbi:beta/alpha barrel domain-containing protein [Catenuloplanes japonicus]|uniref:hypothetical protein n=1 Tax=Catenuloplanes japonicus TaxID=33876 RepID=UPI000524CCFA|nr:hypothetical protein [Catenuloplanes japonicus]
MVAFDHAPLGLFAGLRNLPGIVSALADVKPDAVILNFGPMKRLGAELARSGIDTVLRLDGNRSYLAGDWTSSDEWELFYSVETAVKVGAAGVIANLLLGGPGEMASIRAVSTAAAAAHAARLRFYVSSIVLNQPGGDGKAFGARMAFELGADVVNMYGADPRVVEEAVSWCDGGALLAQGAPKSGQPEAVIGWAKECMVAGATGVCVGEAVWGADDPAAVLAGIRQVTHAVV